MNLEINVKERNTGQVQVSAGYGSSTGVTFGGSVQQASTDIQCFLEEYPQAARYDRSAKCYVAAEPYRRAATAI